MQRYHPVLVALHWLMALMILVALAVGGLILEEMANDDPDKIFVLRGHMSAGIVIGALLIVRLAARFRTRTPPRATTGNDILDRIGIWTHWSFYVLVAGMVLSGIATALGAGLFPIVFGGVAEPVPEEISDLLQYAVHGWVATALAALIVLHVSATVYHQWVLKDGLLRRMWFGGRS
jgi:cytochrome b561